MYISTALYIAMNYEEKKTKVYLIECQLKANFHSAREGPGSFTVV